MNAPTVEQGTYPVVIRPEFVTLFASKKATRAALYNHLLYWVAVKQEHGQPYWYARAADLHLQFAHAWSEHTLKDAACYLETAHLIGRTSNPQAGYDRTKYFYFGTPEAAELFTLCRDAHLCPTCMHLPSVVIDMLTRCAVLLYEESAECCQAFCTDCLLDLDALSIRSTAHSSNVNVQSSNVNVQSSNVNVQSSKSDHAITKTTTKRTTKILRSLSSAAEKTDADDVSASERAETNAPTETKDDEEKPTPPQAERQAVFKEKEEVPPEEKEVAAAQQPALFPVVIVPKPPKPSKPPIPLYRCSTALVRETLDAIRGHALEGKGPIINQNKIIHDWCLAHDETVLKTVIQHLRSGTCENQLHQFWRQPGKLDAFFNAEHLRDLTPSILVELGQTARAQPPQEVRSVVKTPTAGVYSNRERATPLPRKKPTQSPPPDAELSTPPSSYIHQLEGKVLRA